ncbi:probable DNA alkylation repair enzyme [uncultured Gammaproteobacteria bacterium]|jgi:3-methyladenine DNA glycosylase AlkD|uniref:DNA alkylation repair protein n=1 Tax=thiotrophic endosymbiont of Bathymodiolus puteoserpentis (Logatchev) TaxID=343240 RepID=UPI0010B3AC2B|nr:DNA alkylation repair protein [thiotrophic endosymbiont of Bathymodiolus puteoserpentis (Logatchev)]CAC9428996.1 probable DNA alkylation repair enzyme [uncultured Gammaproteobacteria bacterium]CAC9490915.1 probable DNA alkylation repair enzyme [uncultured Gammaproteobacteria bacterium]CAC9585485.1 probable DNA alkylation repair enzyme [uncultured Gammaproteobacteria bacterium]CAC9658857.1 probable DNA alkylation repair enzyme [uncultured Gammaproteobacteria bacterium]SSC09957.1 probable DNA
MNAKIIIKKLKSFATPERKKTNEWFFKTGKGEYSEHDKFIGIRTPQIRQVAKQYFKSLTFNEINELINHPIHEVRHCGLIILVNQYQIDNQDAVFNYYIDNIHAVNNWDLVDTTAPQIVGDYLYQHQEKLPLLFNYLHSSDLWERRIAIVATWTFIKHDEFAPTLKIAKLLLGDKHDLIHKAIGWMLREVYKKDVNICKNFLRENYTQLPRTTLRYAIERMPESERLRYLKKEF